jgi:FkbM family methyltransferase
MSLPRNPYRPCFRVFHRPVLVCLRLLRLSQLSRKWIRVSNCDYAWPLPGILAGQVMQLTRREDFQYLEPNYEPRVCGAIQRLVKPGFVCADVGAHVGYMTLLMAKHTGESGKVFAFEALPENAGLLKRNIQLNKLSHRVSVENVAVTDRTQSEVTLFRGPSSFESSAVGDTNRGNFSVPGKSLDDYFAGKSLNFLKMDIEGAETYALRGMKTILNTQRPTILLEVHDAGWPAVDQLVSAGYALHDLELQPIDIAVMRSQRINHCVATAGRKLECK